MDASNSNEVTNANGKTKQNQKPSNQNRRSSWWDHFIETSPDIAECVYCHTKIVCATKSETTSLQNHVNTCKQYPANIDKKQKIDDLEPKTHVSDDVSIETNQETLTKALAEMLKVDGLPLSFVEGEGFRQFCKAINPYFVLPSPSNIIIDETTENIQGHSKWRPIQGSGSGWGSQRSSSGSKKSSPLDVSESDAGVDTRHRPIGRLAGRNRKRGGSSSQDVSEENALTSHNVLQREWIEIERLRIEEMRLSREAADRRNKDLAIIKMNPNLFEDEEERRAARKNIFEAMKRLNAI